MDIYDIPLITIHLLISVALVGSILYHQQMHGIQKTAGVRLGDLWGDLWASNMVQITATFQGHQLCLERLTVSSMNMEYSVRIRVCFL